MNNMKLYISLALLLCIGLSGQAQFVLSGRVEAEGGTGLVHVEVYHHQSNQTFYSDDNGEFIIGNLDKGDQVFTFFLLEYETLTDTLFISEDMSHVFQMESWNTELGPIDIVAQREELFAIKQLKDVEGSSIFAGKKTEVIIMDMVKGNLANNNGRQVYAQVSGLNIYEGSDGGLQLNIGGRGLDPNRTTNFNTRQNGYDISADVLGYPENYYTPPSEALSEIRIIRGASSLQYGTQFGGLIDFRLRKIPAYKKVDIISTQSIGSFNAFNSFNYVGVNKGKLSVNAFYNYKRGDGYRLNSEYEAHNAFFSADYKFNQKTSLGFELTYYTYLAKQAGGLTDVQFEESPRLSTRNRNWFNVDWALYNLHFKHEFSSSSLLTLSLFSLDASRKSVGYRGDPVNLNVNPITALDEQDAAGNFISPRDLIVGDFNNYGAEARWLSNYKIADKKAVLLIGSKYYQSNNKAFQGPGSTGTDADFIFFTEDFPDYPSQSSFLFPNLNLSLFAENIFYLSDKLSVIPGLRLERIRTESEGTFNQVVFDIANNPIANNLLDDNRVLPRNFALLGIGVSYRHSDRLQLVANVSENYRSVTFSDIRVVSPTFIVDPDIMDERGYTMDLGAKGRFGKIMSYDLTAYSVLYNDRIGIILNRSGDRVRKNIGQAIILGTEALVNLNFARWLSPEKRNYNLNAFVNFAFTTSEYLESEESNVVGNKVEFIPTINLKAGVNYSFKNLDLSYQWTYLSQQYTDVQNSEVAPPGSQRDGIVGPIPAYAIGDLTATYTFKNFSLSSGINNLWNTSYFTRRATGYPGPGIIPSDPRTFFVSGSYRY